MSKNKKQFISQGGAVTPIVIPKGLLLDKIPSAIYTVKHGMSGFYLQFTKKRFEQPEKLYGTTSPRASRVTKVYDQTDTSTGVLLTGLKGSGKSLLMKEIANQMLDKDIPVVIVQDAFSGSDFMSFMESIGECVVLLDEFGKTYKRDNKDGENEQHGLLTFFDGDYSSKGLILLAENKTWDIAELFIDRPSRVLFHWKYERLEEDVVTGFCKDNLKKNKFKEDILGVSRTSKDFTFDSLQAVVEQCNMFHKEKFEDIIDGLNIPLKEEEEDGVIKLVIGDKDMTDKITNFIGDAINGSRLFFKEKKESKDEDGRKDNGIRSIYFDTVHFHSKILNVTTYKTTHHGKEAIIQVRTEKPKYDYMAY